MTTRRRSNNNNSGGGNSSGSQGSGSTHGSEDLNDFDTNGGGGGGNAGATSPRGRRNLLELPGGMMDKKNNKSRGKGGSNKKTALGNKKGRKAATAGGGGVSSSSGGSSSSDREDSSIDDSRRMVDSSHYQRGAMMQVQSADDEHDEDQEDHEEHYEESNAPASAFELTTGWSSGTSTSGSEEEEEQGQKHHQQQSPRRRIRQHPPPPPRRPTTPKKVASKAKAEIEYEKAHNIEVEEIRYFEPIKYDDDDDDDDDSDDDDNDHHNGSLGSLGSMSLHSVGSVRSMRSERSERSTASGSRSLRSGRSNRSNRSERSSASSVASGGRSLTSRSGRSNRTGSSGRSGRSGSRSVDSKGRLLPKNLPPPPPRRIKKDKKNKTKKQTKDKTGNKKTKNTKTTTKKIGGDGHSSLTSLRHDDLDYDDDDDDDDSERNDKDDRGSDSDDSDRHEFHQSAPLTTTTTTTTMASESEQQEQEQKKKKRNVSPRVIPRSPSGKQIVSPRMVVAKSRTPRGGDGGGDGHRRRRGPHNNNNNDIDIDTAISPLPLSPTETGESGGSRSRYLQATDDPTKTYGISPKSPRWGGSSSSTAEEDSPVMRTNRNINRTPIRTYHTPMKVGPATTFHTGGPSELPLITSNHERHEREAAKSSSLSRKPSLRTTTPRTPKTPKTPPNKTPRWGSTAADSPTKMNAIGITPMEVAGMHDTLRVFPSLNEVSSSTPKTPGKLTEQSSAGGYAGGVNTVRTAPKLKKKAGGAGVATAVGSSEDGRAVYHKDVLVPFYGRKEEMKVIAQCLARVSMTVSGGYGTTQQLGANPSEVVLMGGPVGVGKATIMKETIRRFVQSHGDDSTHITNVIYARGHTERNEDLELYLPSSAPLHGLQRALCDLVDRVLVQGAAAGSSKTAKADMSRMVWKTRLKEALGGELHFLAVQTGMVPALTWLLDDEDADHIVHTNGDRVLLQQQKRQPPRNIPFDTNTTQRLQRLSLAVRDLIQTISEFYPVCFHIENIDHADDDTWSIIQYLFADEMKLKNVLLVGTYHYDNQILDFDGGTSVISTVTDDLLILMQKRTRNVIRRFEQKLMISDEADDDDYDGHDDPKPSKMTKIYVEPFDLEQVEELLCGVLIDDPTSQASSLPPAFGGFDEDVKKNAVDAQLDKIQDTAEILYDLTGGNGLHVVHALRLFNDEKLLRVAARGTNSRWDWSTEAIREEVESWKTSNSKATQSLEGLIQTRVQQHTTLEVRVILAGIASLQQTYFTSMNLYRVLSIAYKLDKSTQSQWDHSAGRKFQHKFDRETLAGCPFKNEADVDRILRQACGLGFLKRLSRSHDGGNFPYYAFSHDMIRLSASFLLPKKIKHGVPRDLQIHCMMGIELSAMASEDLLFGTVGAAAAVPSGTPNSPMPSLASPRPRAPPNAPVNSSVVVGSTPPEERERYKFLAADQLMRSGQLMTEDRTSLCLYMVECAEICAVKSAFQTSILYVDTGLGLLIDQEVEEEDAYVDAIGIKWTKSNYPVLIRSYMQLAKMRLACGQIVEANDACDTVLHNAKNLKDRFPAILLHIQLLMTEGRYSDAQDYTMHNLDEYGEKLPRGGWSEIVEREMLPLRQTLSQKTTHALLHPPKMIDKKTIDKMSLLGVLVEICSICQRNNLREMSTVRMMHLSVNLGFTRLYPFAFSYFAVSLNQRAINTDDADLATEAQRFGMIGAKLARLSDYYGGHSVTLYHWHVAHWRRAYKRSLDPVLQSYNAQFDAGDYFHLPMTIFTYSQLHLASGYDLAKLEENLELFSGLYADFQVPDEWRVRLPRRLVMNLMGETAEPLLFVGSTEEEEMEELEHMLEDPSLTESLQHLYFLKLYASIFFNDYELAQDCLSRLPAKVEGVWVPWIVFFQCLVLVSRLPETRGKARKELKENIEDVKGQLIDWYNQGAPNPNAMISLIEAEYEMACNAGKEAMSGLKIQKEFAAVIEAAKQEELVHLEALAYERAGMHFEHAGVEKWCTEYLMKAHSCYDRWNAMAKVIDLENRYSRRLRVGQRRKSKPAEDAAAYRKRNEHLRYDSDRKIGGGQKEIKPINIKKAVTKTTSKVKNFLSPRHLKETQDDFSQEDMDNLQFDLDDDEYNPSSDDDEDGWVDNDDETNDDEDDSTDNDYDDRVSAGRKSSAAPSTPKTKKKQTEKKKKKKTFGANLKSPFRGKKKKV